ncbi:DUF4097 family beta strand repeat-containing protein [Paenibacillus sedimenti]|uniref:DUF4097 family beta strand repeat protein n=1 Tax=Paenibacillus sedimenti TaxID=2770274 RepID=A0A926QMX0_9BACL|nr:DUF4097 family beta strand repeat-containing protein [Paenibacillus sedimenti]MBD0384147.1 DUF4097 family beta strand repeat protein [Paenibacillus sedimenti]
MKRGAKFFLLLGFACLAIGIVGGAISFKETDFSAGTTNIDIEKKIAAANIDTLTIKNDFTGMTFIPSETDEIKVRLVGTVTKDRAKDCTIDAATEGPNTWRVNVCPNKHDNFNFSFNLDELKNLIANYDDQLRTEVTLPDKMYKAITVSTDSGIVNLKEVKSESLTVNADSGDIRVDRFEGKHLNLRVESGLINVVDGQGNVNLRASSGMITAKLHDIGDSVLLEADSGSIELQLSPPPSSASFDVSADSGKATLDVAGVSIKESHFNSVKGIIGDGSKKVRVRADSGLVTVTD